MNLSRSAKAAWSLGIVLLFFSASGPPADAQVKPSAGMMRYPDVSADKIVFSYANDLWIVDKKGGLASPLASPKGTGDASSITVLDKLLSLS